MIAAIFVRFRYPQKENLNILETSSSGTEPDTS
jgi:hypothetical protein